MKKTTGILLTFIISFMFTSLTYADLKKSDVPPGNSKTVQEIISYVNSQNIKNITTIEFENNFWTVKTLKGNTETKYFIPPNDLKIAGKNLEKEDDSPPPSSSKSITEIVSIAKKAGSGQIISVDFDDAGMFSHGVWEVTSLLKNGLQQEIKIDPISGKILKQKVKPIDFDN